MLKSVNKFYFKHPVCMYMERGDINNRGFDPDKTIIENIDKIKWGTYGKSGRKTLQFLNLSDLTTDHLENIIRTETWISQWLKWTIYYVLNQRKSHVPEELFTL